MADTIHTKALLAFTIGPVQDYVSAARRTQDLFVGSRLLAHLMHHAYAAAGGDAHVLYPKRRDSSAPLPNRLIAEYDSGSVAKDRADAITTAIREEWQRIAGEVHKKMQGWVGKVGEWDAGWQDQVDKYLEIYWAVLPDNALPGIYSTRLQAVQRALAARKNLRDFAPSEQPGYKCSIFSGLSALGPGQQTGGEYGPLRAFWTQLAEQLRGNDDASFIVLRPHGRERLSALACMKRFAPLVADSLRLDVPSTSSIAVATYKAALLRALADDATGELTDLLKKYENALTEIQDTRGYRIRKLSGQRQPAPYLHALAQRAKDQEAAGVVLRYDGDLFYLETLTANRIYDDYGLYVRDSHSGGGVADGKDIHDELKQARAALQAIYAYTNSDNRQIPPPSPYFAVLAMDGDRMGALLGTLTDPPDHGALSEKLAEFATSDVLRIVEQDHPGKLIYAGGDDVLALLPLADALAVAEALQRGYSAALQGYLQSRSLAGAPTASAGIAIAHHLTTLDRALATARAAEGEAKDVYGRNAICVHTLKRSGAPLQVGVRHPAPHQPTGLDAVEAARLLMDSGALSTRFAYFFTREAPAFADSIPQAMLAAELRLLLLRQIDLGRLLTFWEAKPAEQAQAFCRRVGWQYQDQDIRLQAEPKNARKTWLRGEVARVLADQLAEMATELSDAVLRERQTCPEPLTGLPDLTATASLRLADWLLVAAFLTRGSLE
ncbi:MAG: type III-B CRISPR-associated protein Cas10/Cmr2 [Chloroflexota bacterium]|nr:type III-B CRISPR-associated protein Cas10/Cmr2 [Chloroflexota bacterium]